MSEYRVDVVTDDSADPIASEYFTAATPDAADRKAAKLIKPHVTDPVTQYGELFVRADGLTAEYVGQVEAAS
jgi:hypothetical protein